MLPDGIHPQAKALVERQRKLRLTPFNRHGVRRLRLLTRATNWLQNRNPPSVGATTDRTVPGPDGDLSVRLYCPRGDGPFPTVVFFHGGGFVFGGLESHDVLCRHLTRESDCVVVAVDYRLAPEHPFPAAVEDAYAAVEWVDENPGAVAGTGELAVAGDSAGGNLAAVTALMAAERDGPDLQYQALFYPGVGVELDQPSVEAYDGIVLAREDLAWFEDCYYGSDVHRRNPYAEPTAACDLSGLPPATVLAAGFDPLLDGGTAYADRLAADGVDVRHETYEDMIHGFASTPSIDRSRDAIADVAGDLRDAFAAV